ncbi:cytochrome P450 2J6-like [Acanthaster planci]|uniref:Cytochrome P450 2J6-like n=1 Tax=Acanthaster planci TaxID=133434 RepID=A0A8B7ZPS9_ACAPL|nr:cytochrome P450 2J6-like [Acanthaster planci]
MRHFSLSTLRGLGVGKSIFEEQIGTEAEELIKAMAAFNGKPFNPKPHLAGAVSNVICSVTFGQRYQYDDQDFQRLLALESSLVLNLGIGGFFFFFGDVGARLPFLRSELQRLETDHNQILAFIKSVIDLHRSKFDSYNLNDFVDAYLMEIKRCAPKGASSTEHDVSVDESSNTRLNNKNLLYVVDDLFSAGSETTVTTLEWCLLHMAIYPEVQQRVQAEIDAVVGRNRRPRLADKPGLNLTRAVIWEVQRMASIVPLGLPHVAAADTQLNGFLIPKGTFIVSNLWRIFRDPTLWPEPESFKPERFLNAEGEAVKPEEFIPFGVGRRICLGQHLAEMELFVFFSYFMHKFTFMKSADAPPLTLEGKSSVTFSPLPFEICAVERN